MNISGNFQAANNNNEGVSFKKYIGIAPMSVIAVNPTADEIEKLTGHKPEKEPVYVGKLPSGEQTARVKFFLNVEAGAETKVMTCTFDLIKRVNANMDKTKVQVIDKYGRTAWVTVQQAANDEIPVYKNGPAALAHGYSKTIVGQDKLISFMKSWLNVYNPRKWDATTRTWSESTDDKYLSKCLCELTPDDLKKIFAGNVEDLKGFVEGFGSVRFIGTVGLQPNKEGDKLYNLVWPEVGSTCSIRDTKRFEPVRTINSYMNGSNAKWILDVCDIKEYAPAPSQPTTIPAGTPNSEVFAGAPDVAPTDLNLIQPSDDLPF